MLKLLNLVLDFLDHRVNLLAKVHDLQDIFHQRNRVQHNVEQESIGPARREKNDRRTRCEKQNRQTLTSQPRRLRRACHRIQS